MDHGRDRSSRRRWVTAGRGRLIFGFAAMCLAMMAGLTGVHTTRAGSQPDEAALRACHRNRGEKLVRIVDPAESCGPFETGFRFGPGERGPQGPPGPSGLTVFTVEPRDPVRLAAGERREGKPTEVAILRNLPPGRYLFHASLWVNADELSCHFSARDIGPGRDTLHVLDEQVLRGHAYDAGGRSLNVTHSLTTHLTGSTALGHGGQAELRCTGHDEGATDYHVNAHSIRIYAIQVTALHRNSGRGV